MPYLSPMWTLVEAVAWISTRKPEFVDKVPGQHGGNALVKLHEMRAALRSVRDGRSQAAAVAQAKDPGNSAVENILAEITDGILSGQLNATARNVDGGTRTAIPLAERRSLEFHIASDLPGKPFGFRNRSDRILRWGAPMVAAADIMRFWPYQ